MTLFDFDVPYPHDDQPFYHRVRVELADRQQALVTYTQRHSISTHVPFGTEYLFYDTIIGKRNKNNNYTIDSVQVSLFPTTPAFINNYYLTEYLIPRALNTTGIPVFSTRAVDYEVTDLATLVDALSLT